MVGTEAGTQALSDCQQSKPWGLFAVRIAMDALDARSKGSLSGAGIGGRPRPRSLQLRERSRASKANNDKIPIAEAAGAPPFTNSSSLAEQSKQTNNRSSSTGCTGAVVCVLGFDGMKSL
ncbi:hypothetical protein AXG93_1783s1190 [Marchantia polymorpha subsp. ruderalis]|uniref:Uncharacterized protein n=1 Tax=Marchantia polymorpha subsp. ruderalis TaxID=1480154 RepID=A0A176VBV0_MARPO|nr:hypothetical protein AXG93_1783s1190 [Marchantia polymorpha subsp. ruderalis]